ncbi:DUF3310 domain-containing protein [Chengkuizengella sp. SCS-71B]|uniref:DUF3310 domain-containing protein n=1 Tax=Chengkuizengella sp. SCS-71B TaxID=3115290 RepID=UPI0032C20DFB
MRREGTPIPKKENELKGTGAGPVTTRQMTSEEREKYAKLKVESVRDSNGNNVKPPTVSWDKKDKTKQKRENKIPPIPAVITKEQYLSRRLNGEKRTPIFQSLDIPQKKFYSLLDSWGIRETKDEEVAMIQMHTHKLSKDELECKPEEKVERTEKQNDPVNRPNHYVTGGIETIDFMQAKLTGEQFKGYCLGNVLKYCTRHEHKNGKEDLKKAQWYLNKLLEAVGE